MPPTQVHHPNRPHQENATTLTHDYAKLQAKAKHDATQIQHIVTWSDSTWDYLTLFHIPMMWVRLPAFPEGCHRKARLRQAEAAVAHCAVLPPAVQAGWRYLEVLLSDAIFGQQLRSLGATATESSYWRGSHHKNGKSLGSDWHTAYSICHMDPYGSCVNRFGDVQHLQSFDNLIVITCHRLVLEIGRGGAKCRRFGPWGGVKSQGFRGKSWDCRKNGHGSREESTTRRGESWAGWRVHYQQSVPVYHSRLVARQSVLILHFLQYFNFIFGSFPSSFLFFLILFFACHCSSCSIIVL